MVSVAVLPPRLPAGMAPPTGTGPADAMPWDERLNWSHNEALPSTATKADGSPEVQTERRKSFLKRAGLTTERVKRNPDTPPFTFRQIPYDEWRKHYAKDAQGNYRGTHAPAEDCLLKPEDVSKWRLGEAKTRADLWTRGTERLPVYEEVKREGPVPDYEDYANVNPDGEVVVGDGQTAEARQGSVASTASGGGGGGAGYEGMGMMRTTSAVSGVSLGSVQEHDDEPRREVVGGKTAKEIIEEQKEKNKNKPKGNMTWKERVKRGAEYAMMGAN